MTPNQIQAANFNISALQRKRETSDTDGESSIPNTPSVDDLKKEKKKKKKAKHQEAESEGLGQETEVEVRNEIQPKLTCCEHRFDFKALIIVG